MQLVRPSHLESSRDAHCLVLGRAQRGGIDVSQVSLVSVDLILVAGFLAGLLLTELLHVGGSCSSGHVADILSIFVSCRVFHRLNLHALLISKPRPSIKKN